MSVFFGVYGMSAVIEGKKILDQVSFELEKGSFTALLGPNGSGKSTLLRACAGIQSTTEGIVRYQGNELQGREQRAWARTVAYVSPDLIAEFPLTALETVLLGRTASAQGLFTLNSAGDAERARKAMEACRCWELRDRELHSLSGGEKQLVSLAKALVQEPQVLLLDETLSRMDLHHQAKVGILLRDLARNTGKAIVLVAHDVNLATEWAESCILLKAGKKLASGKVSEVWNLPALESLYPGAGLKITSSGGKPKVQY